MESGVQKVLLDFLVYPELKDQPVNKDLLDLVALLDFLVFPDLL